MTLSIGVLHGPNLKHLGSREPHIYGHGTLEDLHAQLATRAQSLGCHLHCFQSDSEAALVGRIHSLAAEGTRHLIINPAAFTHTSVALRDALCAVEAVFIEVHLSNPYARETFRRRSLLADRAVGILCGFGFDSYLLALEALSNRASNYDHSNQ